GGWFDITVQKNISQEIARMGVFKRWFEHGNGANDGCCQSVVVPDVNDQELVETSRNIRRIASIVKTTDVHGVRNGNLEICQTIFYRAGEIKISDGLKIGMDSQSMAMLKMQGDRVQELTVSDPSRKLGRIIVTVTGTYNAKGDNFITYPDTDWGSTMII